MIPPHEKPNTQKDKKKKKQRGRKPGHKGACRKNPDTITQTVVHPPLEICPHCQGPITLGLVQWEGSRTIEAL